MVVFLIPMGAFLKGSVALSIMIWSLLIRPEGLFGIGLRGREIGHGLDPHFTFESL
jgi:hypothetical protein